MRMPWRIGLAVCLALAGCSGNKTATPTPPPPETKPGPATEVVRPAPSTKPAADELVYRGKHLREWAKGLLDADADTRVASADALAHFRAMRFVEAYTIWDALAREEQEASSAFGGKSEPPPGPPAKMAERARAFAAHPPPEPWDGVWVLTSK